MPENKTALVILAGGKSSRMGREKSDLILNGNTFLEIQIEKGKQLGIKKIYISGYKGVRCTEEIVMDRIKNRGPLGGLEACFRKASEEGFSQFLETGQASVFRFLNQVGYDCYDTQAEEWYFTNINEPDVYQEICKKEQKI